MGGEVLIRLSRDAKELWKHTEIPELDEFGLGFQVSFYFIFFRWLEKATLQSPAPQIRVCEMKPSPRSVRLVFLLCQVIVGPVSRKKQLPEPLVNPIYCGR